MGITLHSRNAFADAVQIVIAFTCTAALQVVLGKEADKLPDLADDLILRADSVNNAAVAALICCAGGITLLLRIPRYGIGRIHEQLPILLHVSKIT